MKRKKFGSICLGLTALLTFAFSACGGDRVTSQQIGGEKEFVGVHEIAVENTDDYLVRNGASDYRIVYPANASGTLMSAVEELRLFLGRAGGVSLTAVSDAELPSGGNYISVGETAALADAVSDFEKSALKDNGFIIRTVGKNVYIAGGSDVGTLNGAYDFLAYTVNFSVYAPDETQYSTGDIPLKKFTVKDVPDIDYRVGDVTRRIDGDESYRMRIKYNCNDDVFMYAKGSLYHNDFVYLHPDDYGKAHPDWYSESNGSTDFQQLCYTAHGKEDELKQMLDISSDIIADTVRESDAKTVTFMQQDRNVWCGCETCKASYEKYGTNSAAVVKFVNRLSDEVRKKLDDAGMTEREFNISFFAYQQTEKAPAVLENGGYRPIDEEVVCRDNVYVFYAPIYANYNESILSANNTGVAETLKAWNAVSKKTYVWLYQTNFSYYLYPYNSLPTMADRYRFLAAQGAEFLFDQNQWDQIVKTSFHRLKGWMGAKLAWNVNADYNELLDEYFNGYFYDAAEPMRRLFDQITLHMEYLAANTDMDGGIYFHINQYKYFPKSLLDGWLELIEEANKAVEKYRNTDEELYEKLTKRIGIEGISVRYMLLDLYPGRCSAETLKTLQTNFMNDCFKYGIDMVAEIKAITSVFELWGLI